MIGGGLDEDDIDMPEVENVDEVQAQTSLINKNVPE